MRDASRTRRSRQTTRRRAAARVARGRSAFRAGAVVRCVPRRRRAANRGASHGVDPAAPGWATRLHGLLYGRNLGPRIAMVGALASGKLSTETVDNSARLWKTL